MNPIKRLYLRIHDRLVSAAAPYRSRLQRALEGMSARDRMLLYGLIIVFTLVFIGLGGAALFGHIDSLKERCATRTAQLNMISELRLEFEEARAREKELESALEGHEDTTLSAFLEQSADKVQIRDKLKQVKERSLTTTANLEEKTYSVELSRVELGQLVDFLYVVETSGYPLLIRNTKIKTIYVSGQKLLNVDFEISAFRLTGEQEAQG